MLKNNFFIFILLFIVFIGKSEERPIEVVRVKKGTIKNKLYFSGEIKPVVEYVVSADVSAIVKKVFAEVGMFFKTNEVLIELDDSRFKSNYERAKAMLEIAKQKLKTIEKNYNRNKILFNKNVINEKTMEDVETLYINSRLALKEAQANLKLAQINLNRTKIKAPFSGFFVNKNVLEGQMVTPGMILGKLIKLSRVYAYVMIPENKISIIKKGMKCFLDYNKVGRVEYIDLYANKARAYLIKILIDNTDLKLKANMFIKGFIVIKSYKDVPLIPLKCIFIENNKNYIFKVKENKAIKQEVNIIARNKNFAYIDGVSLNDVIVISGQNNLKSDSLIKVIE